MSTSQPRRSTMSLISRPRAPQMTSAVECPVLRKAGLIGAARSTTLRKPDRFRVVLTSPHLRELRKPEDGDERVVEIAPTGQLDVLDARRQLECDLALAVGEQRDLRALAGGVADRDDLLDVDRWHETDDLGALRVEVG